jgi:hypothetical protein
MKKRGSPNRLPTVVVDASLVTPLYQQLYEGLRNTILTGQLKSLPHPGPVIDDQHADHRIFFSLVCSPPQHTGGRLWYNGMRNDFLCGPVKR